MASSNQDLDSAEVSLRAFRWCLGQKALSDAGSFMVRNPLTGAMTEQNFTQDQKNACAAECAAKLVELKAVVNGLSL